MNHEKIDRMKQEYEQIEVPEALKTQVEAGIRKGKRETQKGSIRFLKGAATVAAGVGGPGGASYGCTGDFGKCKPDNSPCHGRGSITWHNCKSSELFYIF